MHPTKTITLLLISLLLLCSCLAPSDAAHTVALSEARKAHMNNLKMIHDGLAAYVPHPKLSKALQLAIEPGLIVICGMITFNAVEFYIKHYIAFPMSLFVYIALNFQGNLQRENDEAIFSDHLLTYSFPKVAAEQHSPKGTQRIKGGHVISHIQNMAPRVDDHHIIEILENTFVAHLSVYYVFENWRMALVFIPSYVGFRYWNARAASGWNSKGIITTVTSVSLLFCLGHYFVTNFGLALRLGLTALGGIVSRELYQLSTCEA